MKIKVYKIPSGTVKLYCIRDEEDIENLKAVLKRYNIKVSLCYDDGELLFWKHELDNIEDQWKLARKRQRQKINSEFYNKVKVKTA